MKFRILGHATAVGMSLLMLSATAVWADDISNNLDASIDATKEVVSLSVGGSQTVGLFVDQTNGDGKNGCNLTADNVLKVSVASSNTSVATVSPSSITFDNCGDTPSITVQAVGAGSADVTLTQTANTTDGSFNLAPAAFTVNVAAAAPSNTAPSVSVTGVTDGSSYNKGNVPVAGCQVIDAEDGNSSPAASLSAISGPDAANGIGSQTASCSYTDGGGLQRSASATYSIVDASAPSISYVVSPATPDGDNGWYKSDVTVTWTVGEGDSTSTLAKTGCVDQSITADQAATSYSCSATSAGGSAGPVSVSIKRDATKPSVSALADPGANTNGWNNSDVTVSYQCSDATSGVDNTASSLGNDVLTSGGSASGTCFDNAGNSDSASYTAQIDKVKPVITGQRSPAANAEGWNNGSVEVSFSCSDSGGSGIETNTVAGATVSAQGANQSVTNTGSCTDKAGNTADSATVSAINIDLTDPTISGSTDRAANGNGWYNANVTVSFNCSDALSGVKSCSSAEVLGEGANQSSTGTAADNAGNSDQATVSGINIDKTAPSVSVTGVSNGSTYTLGGIPAAGCSTSDALSGVQTSALLAISGGPVGSVTATCSGALDNAGNSGSASVTYSVVYNWAGFFSPVDMGNVLNKAKAGSSIPMKFSLGGNQGLAILAGAPIVKQITCSSSAPTDAIETYATTANNGLVYDASADQYNYVWKTQSTYAGKCYSFTLNLNDGTSRTALFNFTK